MDPPQHSSGSQDSAEKLDLPPSSLFVPKFTKAREPRPLNRREQIEAFFKERLKIEKDLRFEDIVFHHAPEATFMTYLVKGTDVDSGEAFERIGVERYTFRDGRIAEKDVYSRPMQAVA